MIKEQIDISQAKKLIKKNFKNHVRGQAGMFIDLGKYGAKLYKTQWVAMTAFESQRKAFENDLGPQAFCRIDLAINFVMYYGYITEIVEVLEPDTMSNVLDAEYWDDYEDEYRDEINDLYDKMIKVGLWRACQDLHPGNIGFKNGKVLCVDFS